MEQLLFDGWVSVLRILVIGALAYITLILFLRISGKRTLSKMNAFDFVVTVALGSTLATVLLSKDVTLVDGAAAFALLIGLQFAVTWSSIRVQWIRRMVTGEPQMLLHRGRFLQQALRRARVTEDEVRAAVRQAGLASMNEAQAVVLETDGSISVVKTGGGHTNGSLDGVKTPVGSEAAPT